MFTRAIVRPPGRNFAAGLTTVELGTPDYATALKQHDAYCRALQSCHLELIVLPPNDEYPDSTFVEDTAILTPHGGIIANPGAESRRGEITSIEVELSRVFPEIKLICHPGTVDGGDICEVEDHFFIGVSARTNESGAQQLAGILDTLGYTSQLVDIRGVQGILHLKSGIAYLGENRLVVIEELADFDEFRGYELVRVKRGEEYAANCIVVNDSVLIAAGFPEFARQLQRLGLRTISIEMSEFQKMDGGLSCLSLRF